MAGQHPILDLLDVAQSLRNVDPSPPPPAEECDVLVFEKTPDGWISRFEQPEQKR